MKRLAEDTGGMREQLVMGSTEKRAVESKFVSELLENGGIAKVTLKASPGLLTLRFTANFDTGRAASVEQNITVPFPQSAVVPRLPATSPKP